MSRWQVTEADFAKPRQPGISGFMRLKNEAEFLDRAFETHLSGLDELVVVYNRCTDETPDICRRWERQHPDKVRVFEYEPEVIPWGAAEAKTTDARDEHSLANYYNWSMAQTTREIVIKVDGDHVGDPHRFARTAARVRRRLTRDEFWPIFGINLCPTPRGIGIYNIYDFHPTHPTAERKGPPPFTGGDHCFYYLDDRTRHFTDPDYGHEKMYLAHKRVARVTLAYLFFHLKGLKQDRGTANWFTTGQGWDEALVAWADRARLAGEGEVASFGEMMVRNPQYFREADPRAEFRRLFPALPLLPDPPLGWTMTRLKETFKNVVSRTGLLHALGREK